MKQKFRYAPSITATALMGFVLLVLVQPALASDVKYSYANVFYQSIELGDVDIDDAKGFGVAGSFQVNENIFVFGRLDKTTSDAEIKGRNGSADFDLDLQRIELGLGYIYSINTEWDVNISASFKKAEEDVDTTLNLVKPVAGSNGDDDFDFNGDDDGFVLKGGVRGMVIPKLEARAFLSYDDIEDDTYMTLGGDFFLTENISLGGDVTFGDTQLSLGGKFYF